MRLTEATLPRYADNLPKPVWSAHWIAAPVPTEKSYVVAYRLNFDLCEKACIRVHLSADQRYRFYVDGELEGEGPDRGDLQNWYYQSHDLVLAAGKHSLVALVWTLDPMEGIMPGAQMTMHHGFVLTADAPFTELLSTGSGAWEHRNLEGINFTVSGLEGAGLLSGANLEIDGAVYLWGIEKGSGEGWTATGSGPKARTRLSFENWGTMDSPILVPGILPPPVAEHHSYNNIRYVASCSPEAENLVVCPEQRLDADEAEISEALQRGLPVRIGAGRKLWILIDLNDYFCGFPELLAEKGKGSVIQVLWAESLYEDIVVHDGRKGNRDEIEGKIFQGKGDIFRVGECREPEFFTSFWWSCGRYVALVIETAAEELVLLSAGFRETRYPLEMQARLGLPDPEFERSKSIMWRTQQMCAHETYMDCPYYEQLNYTGDTRVQALITYVISGDDRLAKKCISLFGSSMRSTGLTQSRYPCSSPQIIPQFSLYWVGMLYDFAKWRGGADYVKRFLPQSRCVLDTFLAHVGDDGLLRCPEGWDWIDWSWRSKKPQRHPVGPEGANGVNQLQLVYILGLAAELERWVGRGEMADYYDCERTTLWRNALRSFWNEERGLFAATTDHNSFDEHAQCFAVLSGLTNAEQEETIRLGLSEDKTLERASYYFQFYLFDAYARLGMIQQIVERFSEWGEMADFGLKTTLEREDPARSDCHAWSAHPLYHAVVSICGIEPEGFGFRQVSIKPQILILPSASVSIPHPLGELRVEWSRDGSVATVTTVLPEGLSGTLTLPGERSEPLFAGVQTMEVILVGGGMEVGVTLCGSPDPH